MKHAVDRVAATEQHTQGIEGYVFDGLGGTQVVFWECNADAQTEEHRHQFDEYLIVVEGCYTLTIDGREVVLGPGQECVIAKGARIAGRVVAGTRTIHMFGGRRAARDAPRAV